MQYYQNHMGIKMTKFEEFIEESKVFFDSYEVIIGDKSNFPSRFKNASFVGIAGKYYLNRTYQNELYQDEFNLVVIVDKSGQFLVPIVWLPKETIPFGFEHVYQDKTCCLGVTHELISIWGKDQTAKDFFDKIVDTFLINYLSYKNNKVCITGDRPHGKLGITDYYKKFFNVNSEQCENILRYINIKAKKKEYAKGHNQCPCESGNILRKCHGEQINTFINSLYADKRLLEAFEKDMVGI